MEGLSAKKIEHMPYIELACLVNHVGGNPGYGQENHDSSFEQMRTIWRPTNTNSKNTKKAGNSYVNYNHKPLCDSRIRQRL